MDTKTSIKPLIFCALLLVISCKDDVKKDTTVMSDNILLKEWTGSYKGVPAFDKMNVEDVKEAVQVGMELSLRN